LPGFLLLGFAVHRWGGGPKASLCVTLVGVVLWLVGLARPTALRLPYMLLMLVAAPIGWIVMRVGLLVVFGLVIVPLALVFRAFGRDALGLKTKNGWQKPAPRAEASSYYRMS
jgi:vacuolar-type H+-ATPase subunit I/STV1